MLYLALVILVFGILIILRPRYFIYFSYIYFFVVPIIFIYLVPTPDIEAARNGGMHLSAGGGISILPVIYLLNIVLFVINIFSNTKRKRLINYIKNAPGYLILSLFIFSIIISLIVQINFMNLDISTGLKKILPYTNFPITIFNISMLFSSKDISKLYKLILITFTFSFLFFFVFSFIPYVSKLSGFDTNYRLAQFLDQGWNGAAALLAFYLFLVGYKYFKVKGFNKVILLGIIGIILLAIVFTYTRAVFLALSFIFLLTFFVTKKKGLIILLLFPLMILLYSWGESIFALVMRGDTNIFVATSQFDNNTFAFRINSIWLPSIFFALTHPLNLLFGTAFRGFNEFLVQLNGVEQANHNEFIESLVNFGIITSILWGVFWVRLLYKFFKRYVNENNKNMNLFKQYFFLLIVFFICTNAMNIMSSYIIATIAIVIFSSQTIYMNEHTDIS